jgi:hypothetical protein
MSIEYLVSPGDDAYTRSLSKRQFSEKMLSWVISYKQAEILNDIIAIYNLLYERNETYLTGGT